MELQELIAFGIVGGVIARVLYKFYRACVVPLLSLWLLKSGRVKWAMRLRKQAIQPSNPALSSGAGCGSCSTC